MAFDWMEYLDVAKDLAAQQTEGSARSAISRAYYAAYWFARKQVNDERAIRTHPGSSHSYVWDLYAQDRNNVGESIGEMGRVLSSHRNMADYDDRRPVSSIDALLRIRQAEKLIADIRSLVAP